MHILVIHFEHLHCGGGDGGVGGVGGSIYIFIGAIDTIIEEGRVI